MNNPSIIRINQAQCALFMREILQRVTELCFTYIDNMLL